MARNAPLRIRLLALALALPALFLATLATGPATAQANGQSQAGKALGKAKRHVAGHGKARRGARHVRQIRQRRKRAQRRHRRSLRMRRARARAAKRTAKRTMLARNVAVSKPRQAAGTDTADVLDAGFENGLLNWNTAGVGDVTPTVTSDIVRSGAAAGRVMLTGDQERSELILGGDGGGSFDDAIHFREGDEAYYAFSFYIVSMVYGEPGAHNLIMQLKGDPDNGSPNFGLQLWDYEGDDGESGGRGLWSHGDAMDGDRFLAPVTEGQWHDVVVHFRASGADAGFYEVFLDGRLIDSRSGVSPIGDGADSVYVKTGLYRNGETIPGTSEIRVDAARLGPTLASVLPG